MEAIEGVGANCGEVQQSSHLIHRGLEVATQELNELAPLLAMSVQLIQVCAPLIQICCLEQGSDLLNRLKVGLQFLSTLPQSSAQSSVEPLVEMHSLEQPAQILAAHHRHLVAALIAARTTNAINDPLAAQARVLCPASKFRGMQRTVAP